MLAAETVRQRVADLAPWFHNLDLAGVRTAPDHFLHDYPMVKWRRFQHAIPADLAGKSVLDIGCNAGFYSLQMKRRGAERVLGIDFDERYLAQARLAAEVQNAEIEFRQLSVYDVAALGERFDIVLFMGVLYHLRHPLLALDLIHEHVARDLLVFQSMQRGSSTIDARRAGLRLLRAGAFRPSRLPQAALHRASLRPRSDQLVGAERRRFGGHAAQRRLRILDQPEDEVFICRRVERPDGAGAVYPAWPPATGAQG